MNVRRIEGLGPVPAFKAPDADRLERSGTQYTLTESASRLFGHRQAPACLAP